MIEANYNNLFINKFIKKNLVKLYIKKGLFNKKLSLNILIYLVFQNSYIFSTFLLLIIIV